MISHGDPIKDETITKPPREPHSYPNARPRGGILLGRYGIIERPVQMTERDVNSHPGDRKLRLARLGHTR